MFSSGQKPNRVQILNFIDEEAESETRKCFIWRHPGTKQWQYLHSVPKVSSNLNHVDIIQHLELCTAPPSQWLSAVFRVPSLGKFRAATCTIPLCPGIKEALLFWKARRKLRQRWSVLCSPGGIAFRCQARLVTYPHLAKSCPFQADEQISVCADKWGTENSLCGLLMDIKSNEVSLESIRNKH